MLAQAPRFAFPCGEHDSSSTGREVEPFRMQLPFPYPLSQGLSKAFSQIHNYYCPSTLTSDSSNQNSNCKLLQFRRPKPVCLPGHRQSGWMAKAFYLHCGNAPSLGSLSETSHQSAGEYLRNQCIRLLHWERPLFIYARDGILSWKQCPEYQLPSLCTRSPSFVGQSRAWTLLAWSLSCLWACLAQSLTFAVGSTSSSLLSTKSSSWGNTEQRVIPPQLTKNFQLPWQLAVQFLVSATSIVFLVYVFWHLALEGY